MRIRSIIYLILFLVTFPASSIAGDRVPLYYIEGNSNNSLERNVDYPVFDISPSLGTVLIDNGNKLLWVEEVRVNPNNEGAAVALLEGTAPEAEWAVTGGGAIPYRRSENYAWFARAAFEADLEPFFPDDEIVGVIEKHKITKNGRISPEAESYITVVDDDFIGEICRSIAYDIFESARGYSAITLNLLENADEPILYIEDTSCQFRVSTYDWRRAAIGDFFRYRDGELHRDGFSVSGVEAGIDGIIGGATSGFSIDENGRLFQRRTAYVEITIRGERFEVTSEPVEFTRKKGEIVRENQRYRDMIDGATKGDLKLYKLPGGESPPIYAVPADTPLDILIYFPVQSGKNRDWYLVESKDIIEGRKYIGWARASDFITLK